MHYLKKCVFLILLTFISVSCTDFLGQVPTERLTEEKIFTNPDKVKKFLADIYNNIPYEDNRFFGGPGVPRGNWTAASSNAEISYTGYVASSINLGAYSSSSGWLEDLWVGNYQAIHSATYFMHHVDECDVCAPHLVTRMKAEARALRALFYFYIFRYFGPPVIMKGGNLPANPSYEQIQKPRATVEETVEYISTQWTIAAKHLPAIPSDVGRTYYGRITKSYLLAMKSQLYLLAASPLYNGNTLFSSFRNPDGTPIIPQQYDESKWKRAADAAKKFIKKYVPNPYHLYREYKDNGEYSAYLSLRDVILKPWNSGIIFARTGQGYDQYMMRPYNLGAPQGYRGGGGLAVTQEMVDAFFMANGLPIWDPNSGYKKTGFSMFKAPYDFKKRKTFNQWVNREPRFYVDVTYNESLWLRKNPVTFVTTTWYGGNSGKMAGGIDHPRTGYIVRKGEKPGAGEPPTIPMMRLAQVFLNYVEALNEYDPGNPDILKYLNKIRDRAGIPGYGYGPDEIPPPQTQAAMRKAIHHERRVELAFENKWYFDVRRWMIADSTESGPIHGMNVLAKRKRTSITKSSLRRESLINETIYCLFHNMNLTLIKNWFRTRDGNCIDES